jgi:hypothetical protein
MFKQKLHWRQPLLQLLLPVFFITALLGFPLPVAPPPATRPGQAQSDQLKKQDSD